MPLAQDRRMKMQDILRRAAGSLAAALSTTSSVMALIGLMAARLSAEVVRIEVQWRSDLVGGQAFGPAGPYEKIAGRIFFAVDPSLPANRIVADLDKAPRNAAGQVEFSSDFFLIKPKQIEKGNGTVLYEVSNRGGKGMLGFYNMASGSLNPTTEADLGDGFTRAFNLDPPRTCDRPCPPARRAVERLDLRRG